MYYLNIQKKLPHFPHQFAGNGLALHNLKGDEFVATYTVVADIVGSPQRADDIGIPAVEDEEDADEEDADEDGN